MSTSPIAKFEKIANLTAGEPQKQGWRPQKDSRAERLARQKLKKKMVSNNIYQVYKVTFKNPPLPNDERKEFFFTSLSAIYDTFTPEQIGCKVSRLWNVGVSGGSRYGNRLCTITRENVTRKRRKPPVGVETLRGYKVYQKR